MLATIHELDSGLRIGLRLTRPSDVPRVRAFLERLSRDARLRRFFMAMPDIDGKYQARAVGKQHLGKAARGGADVEADMVLDRNRILLQRA